MMSLLQHLTSSYWIYDLGVFINRDFVAMQTMARYAYERSAANPGAFAPSRVSCLVCVRVRGAARKGTRTRRDSSRLVVARRAPGARRV